MLATTKAFQKGKELQTKFLNKYLEGTGLTWQFISERVSEERNIKDHAFDIKSRKAGAAGLDVHISNGPHKIRVRCFVFEDASGKYASPNYNLPSDIAPAGMADELIKERAFEFFTSLDLFFLVVRKKGLSTIFWLDKFAQYPTESYTIQQRFKKGRKDRIVLNYSNLNERKFDYIDNLPERLKTAIHENINQ